jgi:hypothetical protein
VIAYSSLSFDAPLACLELLAGLGKESDKYKGGFKEKAPCLEWIIPKF